MLEGRDWKGRLGSEERSINNLQRQLSFALPDEYLNLLRFSDGGEGPLAENPYYFQLDDAKTALTCAASDNHDRSDLSGFFIFGSNGGGEFMALDVRREPPYPVVCIDMVAGGESALHVADNFKLFLELIGRE